MNAAAVPSSPEHFAVTFLAPAQSAAARGNAFLFARKAARPQGRVRIADEDGARRVLGGDGVTAAAVLAGASIEHLARIALG